MEHPEYYIERYYPQYGILFEIKLKRRQKKAMVFGDPRSRLGLVKRTLTTKE